jgi:iron complex transport system substrate-binding protein
MESNTKLYAVLVIVLVVAGSAIVGLMLLPTADTGPSVEVIGIAGTEEFTLSDLKALPAVEREGSFQNSYGNVRGQGTYKGVNVSVLIDAVGGMTEDQWLNVTATDGYNQQYSYGNVYPDQDWHSYQGDMVLAYEFNETEVPDWEEGYRIIFLPDDGYYSNNDYGNSSIDEFLGHAAGPRCVQNVATITIISVPESALTLTMVDESYSYTRAEIEEFESITSSAGYVKTGVTPPNPEGPYNYTGVPVYNLLNQELGLPANYSLQAIAGDGYTVYYTQDQVEGTLQAFDPESGEVVGEANFTMILAYGQDGEPLPSEFGGPLRIVFFCDDDYFSEGHLWAKDVVEIVVQDETTPWQLQMDGVLLFNMSYDTYYAAASCSHHRTIIEVDSVSYMGLPLWILIASMDGADDEHFQFNTTLVSNGYNVTLYSGSGGNLTFAALETAFNSSIIVAGWADGELLTSPDWPLKLVTPEGVMLGNLVKITLTGWDE